MRKSGPLRLTSIDFVNPGSVKFTNGLGERVRSVVDHDVDGTEAFYGGCDECPHITHGAHMAGDAGGVDAHGTQCRLGVRTRVGLSTRDNDASPGMAESFGDRAADPSSTPSDQRHSPIKAEEPIHVDSFGIILHAASTSWWPHRAFGPFGGHESPGPTCGTAATGSETACAARGNQPMI